MDHHIAWLLDMRLPEQRPIVFSNAPSDGDQPEPRLESTLPHGPIPRVCGKLIEHRQYINTYGEDLPEIRNWTWATTK